MSCQKLLKMIDELEAKYIDIWEAVCNIESPTKDKAGVDRACEYLVRVTDHWGCQLETLECENAGNAICITMNPRINAAPVIFSGHMDTVHPIGLFGQPTVRKDETMIYGPGVADCKGGVVASLMAMEALMRCGYTKRPIKLILQTDEETSSKNSNKKTVEFMCEKSRGAVAFFNTEPANGNIATIARKGIVRYRMTIRGIAAHSALCPQGASAIAEAAHKILKLEKFKDQAGITCNCGVINGGTTPNTVAAECVLIADFRFADAEQLMTIQRIVAEVADTNEIAGCSCVWEEMSFRPAMPLTQRNKEFLKLINRIYAENGLPQLRENIGIGGSDAAYITEIGIPCVDSVGVDGGQLHSIKEYARLASLAESAKRLAAVTYFL